MKGVTVDMSKPSHYAEPTGGIYEIWRSMSYRHYFGLIKKYYPGLPGTVLDIGSGSGYFIHNFAKRYPSAVLNGLEYDERLVSLARKRVPQARFIQGNAESYACDEKFDIITSFQVIEHLYEPQKLVQVIKSHLAEDGLAIITTPNRLGFGAKWLGGTWSGYRDDHVSLMSCEECKKIFEEKGFQTIYSGSTFFSGVPWLNKMPFGVINWFLLYLFGSFRWHRGESFVGVFKHNLM